MSIFERRLNYVTSRVKVLETHFVSGRSGSSERTQATPRKDEFNILEDMQIDNRYMVLGEKNE